MNLVRSECRLPPKKLSTVRITVGTSIEASDVMRTVRRTGASVAEIMMKIYYTFIYPEQLLRDSGLDVQPTSSGRFIVNVM